MPQYLVAGYQPDDFDPSTVTEEMMEEIHAINRENDRCRREKVRLRYHSSWLRKVAPRAARWQDARHRRAIYGDQRAHGRLLDSGSRGYG